MTTPEADKDARDEQAKAHPEFAHWRDGYGVIRHKPETQQQALRLANRLVEQGLQPDLASVFRQLSALDRLTSAGLWLVVHMTYSNRVNSDGQRLSAEDFKVHPEGHTGGALNMVPAYAAYLAFNSLTGTTRSWLMDQGHCVAAIDALNVLTGNLHPEQQARYREGGYLGFAELQYAHMPLPGESLVAFLSDGAAEEQRGSDWVPRWWRAEDSGLVMPVMIANSHRIEQRTELGTRERLEKFAERLSAQGFEPKRFDGCDPAAFVCMLHDMERALAEQGRLATQGDLAYPVRIPYGIAESVKGFGFYGAGSNAAHNLPLPGNPRTDVRARELFDEHAGKIWVAPDVLASSVRILCQHRRQQRPLERDHQLAMRQPPDPFIPVIEFASGACVCSPMLAVDRFFQGLVASNPGLRHRVTDPESSSESVHGQIITALNEEAVVSACLANKGGLNLVASDEAFCPRMLVAIRQELIFARHQKEVGRQAQWLGFPIIATSHTWENGKNEQSHQDTTFCESLLGEMNDVSRVLFPADHNSTLAVLPGVFLERGRLSCMVIPKRDRPCVFNRPEAEELAKTGAIIVDEDTSPGEPLLLIASGAYQLSELIRACERLRETDTPFRLVYVQEPGRFRQPRDAMEASACLSELEQERLLPKRLHNRVALTHMRPEVFRGHLPTLFPDVARTRVMGYSNQGGTLNEAGMLFANQSSWAHALVACAQVMNRLPADWLSSAELAALEGRGSPSLITAEPA